MGPRPSGSGSFRDFVRQKPAQIIGAGLIGLIIGGLLGGGAVMLIGGFTARAHYGNWEQSGWERHRGLPGYPVPVPGYPVPGYQECRPAPGGTYCHFQGPYPYPVPPPSTRPSISPPKPMPTISPFPTRTG
ncbi:hypothetical protein [Nonomuraea sp. LPB2021202275-12-8]|uniref:hypothetical protein n=1 Tax=Nonomuraea sp. LPB2021202275-12-8 TaxID=3120159 RepID=UPI00300C2416